MLQVNSTYPFQGKEYALTPGQDLVINLKAEGVPDQAFQVIVYAKIATGHNSGSDEDGELTVSTTIPNGEIKRKVYCRFYHQDAWSYNSENIPLPVAFGSDGVVRVSLQGPSGAQNFKASAQIVGYSK